MNSLGMPADSISSAVAYANDALERAVRRGHAFIPRDTGPMRRRLEARMRAEKPDTGPSLALARYSLKMQAAGKSDAWIAALWGCPEWAITQSLQMFPNGEQPEQPGEPVEQPDLFTIEQSSQCEPTSASLSSCGAC